MNRLIFIIFSIALFISSQTFAEEFEGPRYNETRFDFGHVGIEYILYHDFIYYNRSADTVHLLDVLVTCDCTSARALDTIIAPGDSGRIQMRFETESFFGPVTKAFKVFTDHPQHPEIEYFYQAVVGRWHNGIQPNPISLFFLPTHKKKEVQIANPGYDMITLDSVKIYANNVVSKTLKRRATKGESLKIEISPSPKLSGGTVQSNMTLYISRDDEELPTILTLPIKIARY